MSIMCSFLIWAQAFVPFPVPILLTRAELKWSIKALSCGIVTIMTDACF